MTDEFSPRLLDEYRFRRRQLEMHEPIDHAVLTALGLDPNETMRGMMEELDRRIDAIVARERRQQVR